MSEDLAKEIAELKRRLAELEAPVKPPSEEKPRKPWPKPDYTEGMTMPASAIKPMADLIRDPKDQKFSAHAWAQTRVGGPGGFGPPPGGNWDKGPTKVRPGEKLKIPEPPRSYWSNPNK